jgi:hypothetical protein
MTDEKAPTQNKSPKSKMNKQWILIGLTALGLIALLLGRDVLQEMQQADSVRIPPLPCDLHTGACIASRGNQQLQLRITPGPLESLKPLEVEVRLQHLDARQVMFDLQGVEMYMGLNQIHLVQDEERPDIWRGNTELAVCTTGEMTWRASVYVDTPDNLYSTTFDFDAR